MKKSLLAVLVLIATIGFFIAPLLTDPFMGYRAEHLPNFNPAPPIQPAGYAFSIWGVIYSWLLVSAVFGLWKRRDDGDWDIVRAPLLVALAIGVFWLWIANRSAIWGSVSIIAMAIAAITALMQAPTQDRWWLRGVIGLYAGWLSAASFVSLCVTLAGFNILFGYDAWALIGIGVATLLAITVQSNVPNTPEYGIAVTWALVGIIIANWGIDQTVLIAAAIGGAFVAIKAGLGVFRTQ